MNDSKSSFNLGNAEREGARQRARDSVQIRISIVQQWRQIGNRMTFLFFVSLAACFSPYLKINTTTTTTKAKNCVIYSHFAPISFDALFNYAVFWMKLCYTIGVPCHHISKWMRLVLRIGLLCVCVRISCHLPCAAYLMAENCFVIENGIWSFQLITHSFFADNYFLHFSSFFPPFFSSLGLMCAHRQRCCCCRHHRTLSSLFSLHTQKTEQ